MVADLLLISHEWATFIIFPCPSRPGLICSQHLHANEGPRSPGFKRLDDHLPMGQSVTPLQTPNALGICSICLEGQLTFLSTVSVNMTVRLAQGSFLERGITDTLFDQLNYTSHEISCCYIHYSICHIYYSVRRWHDERDCLLLVSTLALGVLVLLFSAHNICALLRLEGRFLSKASDCTCPWHCIEKNS